MIPELEKAVNDLVEGIQSYESDSFSASEYEVTRNEAELAAVELIKKFLFYGDCPGESIDGAEVGWAIDTVREKNNS